MQPNENQATPLVRPGTYSPVTVYTQDTVGAVFLGIFALLFLIGWIRSEARRRKLVGHRDASDGDS